MPQGEIPPLPTWNVLVVAFVLERVPDPASCLGQTHPCKRSGSASAGWPRGAKADVSSPRHHGSTHWFSPENTPSPCSRRSWLVSRRPMPEPRTHCHAVRKLKQAPEQCKNLADLMPGPCPISQETLHGVGGPVVRSCFRRVPATLCKHVPPEAGSLHGEDMPRLPWRPSCGMCPCFSEPLLSPFWQLQ